jgi:Putative restriction endonuclease
MTPTMSTPDRSPMESPAAPAHDANPVEPRSAPKEMPMSSVMEQLPVEAPSSPEENPYLFSVDDFYRMVDLEILPAGNRGYLWNGQVYEKPIDSTLRAATAMKLIAAMCRAVPSGWFCSSNNSLTLGPDKAPTPDMAVIRGKPEDYLDRRPDASDSGLVIEMADEIPGNVVGRRLASYASAGIPTCWVIDLKNRLVHVHELPTPLEGRFASVATVRPGESFPLTLDRIQVGLIAASDLLPIR